MTKPLFGNSAGAGAIAALVFLVASHGSASAQGKPSFDCAKASSVAEKAICADPALAEADAAVAQSYAQALKALDPRAGKALRDDQRDFTQYRDDIAAFNENTPKDKQTFDLAELLRDRAAFLASIKAPASRDFVGTWNNVRGEVEIKAAAAGTLDVSADTVNNPVSGNGSCEIGGTVPDRKQLRLVDTDDNDKPTGFVFTFRRDGDQLIVEQSGSGKDDRSEPPSCGANGHVDGNFFQTDRQK